MKTPRSAALLAATWAALLALLGWLWVNTPALGHTPALLAWTLPAAALGAWTRRRLGGTVPLPGAAGVYAAVALGWTALLVLAWRDLGREMAMDGMILREPVRELAGRVVTWTPFVAALLFGLAMLALSLEARYRLAHPEKYERARA